MKNPEEEKLNEGTEQSADKSATASTQTNSTNYDEHMQVDEEGNEVKPDDV